MIAVAIMWSAFLFPYIARFENTVKQTLKNAFLLMIRHLPWALLLLVILIASALSIYIIPVLLVVIPAVTSMVFDFIYEPLSEAGESTTRNPSLVKNVNQNG